MEIPLSILPSAAWLVERWAYIGIKKEKPEYLKGYISPWYRPFVRIRCRKRKKLRVEKLRLMKKYFGGSIIEKPFSVIYVVFDRRAEILLRSVKDMLKKKAHLASLCLQLAEIKSDAEKYRTKFTKRGLFKTYHGVEVPVDYYAYADEYLQKQEELYQAALAWHREHYVSVPHWMQPPEERGSPSSNLEECLDLKIDLCNHKDQFSPHESCDDKLDKASSNSGDSP